ncbi:dTDP-4-dehydrorhamnose reductase [Chloroflexota bacterium]
MRVLVTGANGQLGTDVCKALKNVEFFPFTHDDIEIKSLDSIRQAISSCHPDAVINTAAYVKVNECEIEQDEAFAVNALGARNVAVVCQEIGSKLVHISTDYVFGGEFEHRSVPYTEFDTPIPPNTYGKTKLQGDNFVQHFCNRHFVVRCSALFGIAGSRGKGAKRGNFVQTILRLAQEQEMLRVVNDQICSPTYTVDIAHKITELIATDLYGIFHITNKGNCSWYEFAKHIVELSGQSTPVIPITSEEYTQEARRPFNSSLDNYHLRLVGMDDMRPWQEALRSFLEEIKLT